VTCCLSCGGESASGSSFQSFRRTLALLALLVVSTIIEEVVLAMIHGGSPAEAVANLGGGTAYQAAATIMVMFLILVPYVAFNALSADLGEGTLHRMLFDRPRPPTRFHRGESIR
jgi:hypothetical protein